MRLNTASLSFENMPRQKSFGCLSLRFGCIFTALATILYTILALAQCLASLDKQIPSVDSSHLGSIFVYCFEVTVIICHIVTLILTTIMLVGVLKEKSYLMKPWLVWTSCLVLGNLLLIIFCTVLMMVFNRLEVEPGLMVSYLVAFVALLFRIYMLTLVGSFYLQLEEEKIERLRTLLNTDSWHSAA
ncbi:unnamed protein product [Spodoptera exigua]|uniref:Uncharacterized protein n=1 Tax=Spodoptera exigua TaxID=7107 RepID=A0A835GP64_SPOEX|nr:hypothetical protein HW555_003568 [Spodoptera exigua]KAH9645102.1 hypothetical protein HF086_005647 [Spodoptera exigua]CAH0686421.1 unnamed protein product [Spodoptera exigua]